MTRVEDGPVLKPHRDAVTSLLVSADLESVVSVSQDGFLKVHTFSDGRQVRAVNPCSLALSSVCSLGGDEKTLVMGAWDDVIYVYSIDFGSVSVTLEGHDACVSGVAMPTETELVSASWDGTVKIWERKSKSSPQFNTVPVADFQEHDEAIKVLAVAPAVASSPSGAEGPLFATGGSDGSLIVWSLAERRPLAFHDDHPDEISALCFTPDGAWVVSASLDGSIRVAETEGGGIIFDVDVSEPVHTLACDGTSLLAGTESGSLRVWELAAGGTELSLGIEAGSSIRAMQVVGDEVVGVVLGLGDGSIVRYVCDD